MSTLYVLPSATVSNLGYYVTKTLVSENAGFDLYIPEDIVFAPGERKMVKLGISAAVITNGVCEHFWLVPRSSLSKTGLLKMNSIGVIDSGYRGELMAALWNTKDTEVLVKKDDRLFQIVSRNMTTFEGIKVVDSLPASLRGDGGFGSTGR